MFQAQAAPARGWRLAAVDPRKSADASTQSGGREGAGQVYCGCERSGSAVQGQHNPRTQRVCAAAGPSMYAAAGAQTARARSSADSSRVLSRRHVLRAHSQSRVHTLRSGAASGRWPRAEATQSLPRQSMPGRLGSTLAGTMAAQPNHSRSVGWGNLGVGRKRASH